MGEEIERKFLVKELPKDIGSYGHKEITQGYINITPDTEERVRAKGEEYFHTIKIGGGLSRSEEEKKITRAEYEAGLRRAGNRIVEKTRYKIPHGDRTIELDIYHGRLNGLVTAEVEFPSAEASRNFESPSWFGKEVTEDKRYKNQSLAVNGIPSDRI